jgi:hypothetical protein
MRTAERVKLMIGKFRKTEPSIEDEAITKVLTTLEVYDTDTEEFEKAMTHLERLTKLKAERQRKVSPDTMAIVGANLLGILLIIAYEQKHVMNSKAMGFLLRAK